MLDDLIGFLVRDVMVVVLRVLLFPVALLICTPFILVHAAVTHFRGRHRFRNIVADDYASIDVLWWS